MSEDLPETNKILNWAVAMKLPWKCDRFDILNREDKWIGEFHNMEVTEQVVSIINGIFGLNQKLDEALESAREAWSGSECEQGGPHEWDRPNTPRRRCLSCGITQEEDYSE